MVISTRSLSVRFGSIAAVNHLNLNVPEECVYGFLGPNGAGKTTTIRALLGLIRPTGGKINIFGKPMPGERIAILRNIGSIVEDPALYLHSTGYDNLRIVQIILQCDRSRIDEVLQVVNLQHDANRRVGEYSLGMKQRLALARALLGKPKLLILDEPTNGLDPAGILEVRSLIRAFPKEFGVTVFLSSHLLSEIEQIADYVGIVKNGSMVFEGELNDLRKRFSGHVKLRTDNNGQASELLEKHGFHLLNSESPETLNVNFENERDAAQMVKVLVTNNISVFHLSQEERSLENIFLSLTAAQT
jgi:lantibiotic transport system ATP-binding protein